MNPSNANKSYKTNNLNSGQEFTPNMQSPHSSRNSKRSSGNQKQNLDGEEYQSDDEFVYYRVKKTKPSKKTINSEKDNTAVEEKKGTVVFDKIKETYMPEVSDGVVLDGDELIGKPLGLGF